MYDDIPGIAGIIRGISTRTVTRAEALKAALESGELLFVTELPKRPNDEHWPPVAFEWLRARLSEENVLEVIDLPFFSLDFSCGDIVRVDSEPSVLDGAMRFVAVERRGGRSTYRIKLLNETAYSESDKIEIKTRLLQLAQLGCNFAVGEFSLVAIDAGPDVALVEVCDVLNLGESSGAWFWEAGHLEKQQRP